LLSRVLGRPGNQRSQDHLLGGCGGVLADLDGRPLDARRLAREMSRYTVRPTTVRIGGQITKGYQAGGANGLADAASRWPRRWRTG
jgi:hypothetical protein